MKFKILPENKSPKFCSILWTLSKALWASDSGRLGSHSRSCWGLWGLTRIAIGWMLAVFWSLLIAFPLTSRMQCRPWDNYAIVTIPSNEWTYWVSYFSDSIDGSSVEIVLELSSFDEHVVSDVIFHFRFTNKVVISSVDFIFTWRSGSVWKRSI